MTESLPFLALPTFFHRKAGTQANLLGHRHKGMLTDLCLSGVLTWQSSIQTCWARTWVFVAYGRVFSFYLASSKETQRASWDGNSALASRLCMVGRHWASLIGQGVLMQGSQMSVAGWRIKFLPSLYGWVIEEVLNTSLAAFRHSL